MSFSFVVNGHAMDINTNGENEMKAVQSLLQSLLSEGESAGLHLRIDGMNPPDWALQVQENFTDQYYQQQTTQAKGSEGNTGEGAMGVPQTPEGPAGEQTQTST